MVSPTLPEPNATPSSELLPSSIDHSPIRGEEKVYEDSSMSGSRHSRREAIPVAQVVASDSNIRVLPSPVKSPPSSMEISTFSGSRVSSFRQGTSSVAGFASQPGSVPKTRPSIISNGSASGSRPHSERTSPPSPLPHPAPSPTTPASSVPFQAR